ncbi:hypothetical protein DPMN_142711 [Dreissena polymorpha]|uniref:Uncharacterized protein n=1 Tax=Dreissena polymorpha TaxID=45954 RepID=A0A9D4GHS0_DREPO|nr:hypothetical protein DPMN_142711 [Dreissena polymorpha]
MSVGYLRSSVSREGLYIVAVPRSQNTPPPHKRTHAERARAPPPPPPPAPAYGPGPSAQPLKTLETSTLIHPLAARDNRSVKNQPWSPPKPHPESPSFFPTHLPNIQTIFHLPKCGYCALRPMRGYRKRPDSRGAPGSFKCPVYSTDTLHPRLTSLAEDILVHSVILLSCVISYGNVGSLYCGVVIYLMKEERAEESAHVSVSGYKSKDSIPMCFCNMPENPPMGLATNRMDAMPAGIAMLFFDADSGPDMTDLTDST